MMASLPSVVLGFLAALVIAPFVEGVVPAVLRGVRRRARSRSLLGALPVAARCRSGSRVRSAGWPRLLAIALLLPLGVLRRARARPGRSSASFFARRHHAAGSTAQSAARIGGWMLLLLPLGGARRRAGSSAAW